jgi:hypothetical protein
MSYIILEIIMGVAFIGMLISAKKQSSNSLAKPLVFVFAFVLIACGIIVLVKRMGPPDTEKYVNEKLTFTKSAGYKLARFFAESTSGGQVVIFRDPTREENKFQQALIEGLKKGFAPEITNVIVTSPLLHRPSTKAAKDKPISELLKSADINKILKRYSKCKIIVSLAGLPKDIKDLNLLHEFINKSPKTPKIALLNCRIKDMYKFMKAGFISAVVYPNPSKKYSEDVPSDDLQKTFDMRYLLITPKNMDEISKEFPGRVFRRSAATPPTKK